jgi:hypothetical protein
MKKQKKVQKLTLKKETLHAVGSSGARAFDSCIDSCYLVSCGGGCGISTGMGDTVIE